jgi:uncharacterized OB-fold protein
MTALSDAEVLDRFPTAYIDRDNVEFFRAFLERRLVLNRCRDCGTWNELLWPNCPACWSESVKATEVSGRGHVYTFVILHTGQYIEGVDYQAGHPLLVVELEEQEGLRATATMVNCAPQDISIGMPVKLTWIERGGNPVPAFEPA